jgi:hypothetical protein
VRINKTRAYKQDACVCKQATLEERKETGERARLLHLTKEKRLKERQDYTRRLALKISLSEGIKHRLRDGGAKSEC